MTYFTVAEDSIRTADDVLNAFYSHPLDHCAKVSRVFFERVRRLRDGIGMPLDKGELGTPSVFCGHAIIVEA